MMKSQHSARSMPRPAAAPLTAATVGFSSVCRALMVACSRRCLNQPLPPSSPGGAPRRCFIAEMSPPAQNAGPLPVSTRAVMSGSLAARSRISSSSERVSSSTALRTLGRLKVATATPESIFSSTRRPSSTAPQLTAACYQPRATNGRMRYGYFMMPMHSPGSDLSVTLQTDLSQVERLDELGFDEAWIGEHFTAEWENIPAPDIFIGAALQRTRAITFGTGVSCLPNHNPFHLAHRIAMLDHLARGRFFWGIGSGGFPGDFEVVGIDPKTGIQRQMSIDTVDAVLALWEDPRPGLYERHGWSYHVPEPDPRIRKHVFLKPYQQPHPPIAVAGVTEKSETLGLAGERGWIPM